MGTVCGPKVGPVEDVAELRQRCEVAERERNDSEQTAGYWKDRADEYQRQLADKTTQTEHALKTLADAERQLREAAERPDTLPWKKHDPNRTVGDGDQFLCAVPTKDGNWCYSMVTVACDEDSFDVLEADETWCWDWYAVAWKIRIDSKFAPPKESPPPDPKHAAREALQQLSDAIADGDQDWSEQLAAIRAALSEEGR